MSQKQLLRKRRRQLCVGDLRDRVQIRGRVIVPPAFGAAEFDEKFSDDPETWARINTTAGKTVFDGVSNSDVAVTHEIGIRFDDQVTTECWVELENGSRLDVVLIEDLDERHEWMLLSCVERGDKDLAASKA